jgi:hypothetical protein
LTACEVSAVGDVDGRSGAGEAPVAASINPGVSTLRKQRHARGRKVLDVPRTASPAAETAIEACGRLPRIVGDDV